MNEEEFLRRILNKIAKEFGYDVASTLELMFMTKEKELDQYKNKVEYYENFEINKTVDKIRLEHNKEIKELHQKLDQYKNNWEELKKWLNEEQKLKGINAQMFSWGVCGDCLNKMKELEEDK